MKSELYKQLYIEMFRIKQLLKNNPQKAKEYNQNGTFQECYDMKDSQFTSYDNGIILYACIVKNQYNCTFCVYEIDFDDDSEITARCTVSDEYMWIHSIKDKTYSPHLELEWDSTEKYDLYNNSTEIDSQRFQNQLIIKPEYIEYMDLEYALRGHIPSGMYISYNVNYAPNLTEADLESLIIELKKVI